MAQFELNIYGSNDEILKTYATDKVRWGVFMQAQELNDGFSEKAASDQIKLVSEFIKKIFPDLTNDDLENADVSDVMNTFKQLLNMANKIGGNAKNAAGAATE